MMTDRDDKLEALLDREAIRDLPTRYCDCVWQDDLDSLLKLFAKDGEFIIDNRGTRTAAQGLTAMRKMYRQGLSIGPRPYIHNHVIMMDDATHAHGRAYLALHSIKQNMQFIGAGYYNDSYVKVKGVWKFQRRHFVALRIDEDPMGGMKPAKKAPPAREAKPTGKAKPVVKTASVGRRK